ncbi:Gas2-like protein 1-like [Plakobranchus ocellatus]|uniref:Gas2-like protein 1-like n=1 Tax=Plakobranchus ocellatus TaxID=259542 RepID=A0AAV3YU22_9GAST|nr:Gas2-like protein 1-like [Plakobranchus ocellatus]
MVRVGGGWDTLENYLNKHDPCQCNYKGHRAGTSQTAHKLQVNQSQQQRRASTPGGSSAHTLSSAGVGGGGGAVGPNTPTSPRRMSSAAPSRHRSVSPQNVQPGTSSGAASTSASAAAKHNPPRSKSPTLIISRHAPTGGGGGGTGGNKPRNAASSTNTSATPSFSVSRVSSGQAPGRGEGAVSKSWSQPLSRSTASHSNINKNNSTSDSAQVLSTEPIRCKSPSPGRLRSPSPLNAVKTLQQSPAPFNRTASGSSLVKGKGQEQRVSTPRRLPGSSMISDNEEEENERYADEDEDFDHEESEDNEDESSLANENKERERAINSIDACQGYADDVSDTGLSGHDASSGGARTLDSSVPADHRGGFTIHYATNALL